LTDETDLKLLAAVQESFPITSLPFEALGATLGLEEAETLARLERLVRDGLVRRIGPILDLRKLGCSGVLVAVQVAAEDAEEVSQVVNGYREVSHNYLRPNDSGYNLWFTVSASEGRIQEILNEIRAKTGKKQVILPTKKIFKIGVKFDII
jgi:DNA-binding Lrp family transcriptional regulator